MLTEPLWLKMGASLGGNGIGSTYVEIDYTNQRMWFYKDGALLVDSLVVTGNVSRDMASPEGIFGLYYKETNATLEGEDYKTPVDFWMPFYGGVGIHDAKWRSKLWRERCIRRKAPMDVSIRLGRMPRRFLKI